MRLHSRLCAALFAKSRTDRPKKEQGVSCPRVRVTLPAIALAAFVAMNNTSSAAELYRNASATIEQRIADLLPRLTLEEKISLLAGKDGGETKTIPRLGIPLLRVIDGPHGVGWGNKATCFPSGVSMGACWNPELIKEVGRALALETRGADRHILLGPCVGIHRTPLGGRNFESFSEDPYHAGRIGVAYVQGVQSEGIGTSLKHYACNNQEWERTTISVEVDERALREIYLPHFKMVVEESDPWTVMASYNKLRGEYLCANRYLLTDILKKEFGFKGVVVSDWGAVHGTEDSADAGLDLEMPGPGKYFGDDLLKAVRDGKVKTSVIDDKVRRILRMLLLAGVLDEKPAPRSPGALNAPEHHELARRLAEEAIVLLKNDKATLPLRADQIQTVAVIGPNADAYRAGGGSSTVHPVAPVTPLAGLRERCGDRIEIRYAQGCTLPQDLLAIPSDQLAPPDAKPGEHGLRGEYFDNMNLEGTPKLVRVDAIVDFNWGQESPSPEIPGDHFSVRWTGTFTPEESGTYSLGMNTDDGCRLYLDGKLIVDSWIDQGSITRTANVELEAGRAYEIRAEYFENYGIACARIGWLSTGDKTIQEAAELARRSDVAIVFAGLSGDFEAESMDRSDLKLPGKQALLIQEVAKANPFTIVVLINGTPVEMSEWAGQVPAIVEAWYPGQKGGDAIARVLFGDANPSGKLPCTFPKRLEDNPSFGNYPGADGVVKYAEGIYVGYRYYDTKEVEPLFPFGHGLSYTTFRYDQLKVERAKDGVVVTADIENTGPCAGAEVVQLYVHDLVASLDRPAKELKAFKKIALQPGEKQAVSFKLKGDAFAFYHPEKKKWVVEPGEFDVMLGSSSRDIRLTGRVKL